ncbi:enhancer of split malpha protein [Drosophila innubila]|uniref:enhancer of split malpha protein n=1 Tax=Drosophila innubila TaxID=198719 RepID=UPI00148CA84A|nr:enhancer of split malpha protein [Drosophila innubila]
MCQQVAINNNNKMKNNYSIKQVLKTFFKKQQKQQQQLKQQRQNSLESLESVDNLRNAEVEEVYYAEIDENAANEKLAQLAQEQEMETEEDIYVPVRFARTEAGTFFWTTNLQPVASVDADLLQPAYCYSSEQHPFMQYQDRWAQA